MWDAVVGGRRAAAHHGSGGLVSPEGGLVGPFNAWLHCPVVGKHAADLGEAIRFDTHLDRRLLELSIVAVAVHWRAEFEFWAHRRFAVESGVDETVIDELAAGRAVEPARDDERIVLAATLELLRTGRWSPAQFTSVHQLLGVGGAAELVTVIGYYTAVSLNLNAFEVPAPAGVDLQWPVDGDDAAPARMFLVIIEFAAGDVPDEVRSAVLEAERSRGLELYRTGTLCDIWGVPGRPGCSVGVWSAANEDELLAILEGLPIAPWSKFSVEPLDTHPLIASLSTR